ncbi:MAG TPA: hypothetical protein VFV87_06750, partial [Pirellulaceae bacterium]|nr:hypothetical protein [Pirellulaceae bacterium]
MFMQAGRGNSARLPFLLQRACPSALTAPWDDVVLAFTLNRALDKVGLSESEKFASERVAAMWKVFWVGAFIAVALGALAIWASIQTTFLFVHPRAAGVRVVIDKQTGRAVVASLAEESAARVKREQERRAKAPLSAPKVETAETNFDFGTMNP